MFVEKIYKIELTLLCVPCCGSNTYLPFHCRARYEDAKFFYKMDTSKRFSDFRSQLNGILFHVSRAVSYGSIMNIFYYDSYNLKTR